VSLGAPEMALRAEMSGTRVDALAGQTEALTPRQLFWRRFRSDRAALVAAIIVIALLVLAIAAPLVVRLLGLPGPDVQDVKLTGAFHSPTGPTLAHPFGVDQLGRDLLSRALYALRLSLAVAVAGTAVAALLGCILGLLAGWFGRWPGVVISLVLDLFQAFPVLVLGLALGAACGAGGCVSGALAPGAPVIIFIIAISSFAPVTRIVRGQVLALGEEEFVAAARSLGASPSRILFREIAPNLVAPVVAYSILLIATNMLLGAALTFLGVGGEPPGSTLGGLIAESRIYLPAAWWYLVLPGVVLLLAVVAFNVAGDGLLRALNLQAVRPSRPHRGESRVGSARSSEWR